MKRPGPWEQRTIDTPEWMDAAAVDRKELDAALVFIRRVNHWFGYTRATVDAVLTPSPCTPGEGWSGDRNDAGLSSIADPLPNPPPRVRGRGDQTGSSPRLTVLDVATGSADVPLALEAAAERAGVGVHVVGLDLHAATLDHARAFAGGAVPLVRGDALALPFGNKTFDVATASMFLHHLPDELVVQALAEMGRVGRRVVVADLIRNRRALMWITLFTLASSPMIRHDARVSVRQAFTLAEIERLANAAGLKNVRVRRRFAHRFLLTAGNAGSRA